VARLVLVGLPGVGKTTVARALAERWACEAIDTDELIAISVAMPSPQYLRQFGETHFRERELDALRSALVGDAVVATGAGVVTTATARGMISQELAIWLDADDDTLSARVATGEDRPLLGDDRSEGVRRLRAEREKWYRECSRMRVSATGTPDEVLERIVAVTQERTS
jgi:shikimate kinase